VTDGPVDLATSPEVAFLEPANGAPVANPVRFHLLARGVHRVALDADGYSLGEYDPALAEGLEYTFTQLETPRQIHAVGFDEDGVERASATLTITVTKGTAAPAPPIPSGDGVRLTVPYFYQYNNSNEPGGTCGLTSAAMLLNYWFPNSTTTPDKLYDSYGKSQGQSPTGLAELYRLRGLNADSTYSGSRANVRAQIDAGRPVIVHGNLTASGHILVILGYDAAGFYINDPAGDWYQCYGCGTSGAGLHIDYDSEFDRKLGADGDMWLSAASKEPFDPFP